MKEKTCLYRIIMSNFIFIISVDNRLTLPMAHKNIQTEFELIKY